MKFRIRWFNVLFFLPGWWLSALFISHSFYKNPTSDFVVTAVFFTIAMIMLESELIQKNKTKVL